MILVEAEREQEYSRSFLNIISVEKALPRSQFKVRDTAHLSIAQLAEATNSTFAGYFMPVAHTPEGFATFCRWYSIDTARSVLLEHRDGRLAGLAMLALRGDRGWCGGLGIVPTFRGLGLAAHLTQAMTERARGLSLHSLQLEVLVQNEKAVRTYRGVGFEDIRDLVILSGDASGRLPSPDPALTVQRVPPMEAWLAGASIGEQPTPCWQREAVSLFTTGGMSALIARRNGLVQAVLLYRRNPPAGPVTIVHLPYTEPEAAQTLLFQAAQDSGHAQPQFYVLNEPDGSPLLPLLRSLGLNEVHRQHEMQMAL